MQDEPEEQHEQRTEPRSRAAERSAQYKRRRQAERDAAKAIPNDLMSDAEIEPHALRRSHRRTKRRSSRSSTEHEPRCPTPIRVVACAPSATFVFKKQSCLGRFCDAIMTPLKQRCSAARYRTPLKPAVIAYYNCSDLLPALDGVLLSRTAFLMTRFEAPENAAELPCVCGKQAHSGTMYNLPMSICDACRTSLMRKHESAADDDDDEEQDATEHDALPPKFAIANGFAIGGLPAELRDVSVHEVAMVAQSVVSGNAARRRVTNFAKSFVVLVV